MPQLYDAATALVWKVFLAVLALILLVLDAAVEAVRFVLARLGHTRGREKRGRQRWHKWLPVKS